MGTSVKDRPSTFYDKKQGCQSILLQSLTGVLIIFSHSIQDVAFPIMFFDILVVLASVMPKKFLAFVKLSDKSVSRILTTPRFLRHVRFRYYSFVLSPIYRIRPNYRTVPLDFSKLLNKLVVNYQPNKGTL